MAKRDSLPDPLRYPLADQAPKPGEAVAVAEGLYWLRMPMDGRLDHINVWLLEDYDGWTIVDTGLHTEKVQETWRTVFAKHLGGKPITRVIATHLHGDHTGNAGWLTREWSCDLWMSRTDFYMCKVMAADGPSDVPEDAIRFYRRAGFSEERLDRYRERFGQFGSRISQLPAGFHRVIDGQSIDIGGREWRAMIGHGHAPEHVCLHCPELGVFISGDQILPRITPNVGVQPSEPSANPLQQFLATCARFREHLPSKNLILPAHENLFEGVHERLTALIDWHETGLAKLYDLCEEPKRSVDVFPALFRSPITEWTYFPATGEAIAHLHCAAERRMLVAEEDENGVAWWRQA